MWRLNSSVQHDPQKNYQIISLDWYKILALAGTHSVTLWLLGQSLHCTPGFPCPMLNQQLWIWFPIAFNPTPANHCWWWTEFEISEILTPRLTTNIIPASYCILSIGQGIRALTKKLPGSSLLSLDMLPNLLWISTLHIQPSLVPLSSLWLRHISVLKFYLKSSHFLQSQLVYLLFYSLIVESLSSTPAPKPPSNLGLSSSDTILLP